MLGLKSTQRQSGITKNSTFWSEQGKEGRVLKDLGMTSDSIFH